MCMTRKELTDFMDAAREKSIEEIKAARLRSADLLATEYINAVVLWAAIYAAWTTAVAAPPYPPACAEPAADPAASDERSEPIARQISLSADQIADLERTLRSVGIALNACNHCVTSDDPEVQPVPDRTWRIDHSQELADFYRLAQTLGLSTGTGP